MSRFLVSNKESPVNNILNLYTKRPFSTNVVTCDFRVFSRGLVSLYVTAKRFYTRRLKVCEDTLTGELFRFVTVLLCHLHSALSLGVGGPGGREEFSIVILSTYCASDSDSTGRWMSVPNVSFMV